MMIESLSTYSAFMQSTISLTVPGDRCLRKSPDWIACRIRSFALKHAAGHNPSLYRAESDFPLFLEAARIKGSARGKYSK